MVGIVHKHIPTQQFKVNTNKISIEIELKLKSNHGKTDIGNNKLYRWVGIPRYRMNRKPRALANKF
jgi:hypothetical protein